MTTTALTMSDLVMLAGLVATVLTLWTRINTAIEKELAPVIKSLTEVTEMNAHMAAEMSAFKTEVAKDYVRNGYMRDVEERVLKRIDGVVAEIHGMRGDLSEVMKLVARGGRR